MVMYVTVACVVIYNTVPTDCLMKRAVALYDRSTNTLSYACPGRNHVLLFLYGCEGRNTPNTWLPHSRVPVKSRDGYY